jgi:hypothetical protein
MTTTSSTNTTSRRSGGIVAGAILILFGAMALVENIFHAEFVVLPILAAAFILAGLLRKNGLIIPGSIIAGISLGVVFAGGEFTVINDTARGGAFFLCLAGGFALISALSVYTRGAANFYRWPFFPAAGLALFGGALLAGIDDLLLAQTLSYAFPAILIVIGLGLILRRK